MNNQIPERKEIITQKRECTKKEIVYLLGEGIFYSLAVASAIQTGISIVNSDIFIIPICYGVCVPAFIIDGIELHCKRKKLRS